MKSEWRVEKCADRPEQFQQLSENVYLQRKGIRKAKDLEDGTDGGYECENRRISKDVYDALIEDMQSPAAENMMQTLSDLQAEQTMQSVMSDSNTETIMQAISDLQADVALIGV